MYQIPQVVQEEEEEEACVISSWLPSLTIFFLSVPSCFFQLTLPDEVCHIHIQKGGRGEGSRNQSAPIDPTVNKLLNALEKKMK